MNILDPQNFYTNFNFLYWIDLSELLMKLYS